MGRKAITQGVYDRITQGFRDDAPNYRPVTVAKAIGVDPATAVKAWKHGWPRRNWVPIRETIQQEQVQARALLLAEQAAKKTVRDKELADAQAQATASQAQEGKLVNITRGSALQCLAASALITTQARALAELIKSRIEHQAKLPPTDAMALTANSGLVLLDKIATTLSKIVHLSHQAMVMERLHLGQPGALPAGPNLGDMTMEEADVRLDVARQALEKAKDVGGLKVIDGGIKEPVIGKRVVLV